jgi:hypothetical protein
MKTMPIPQQQLDETPEDDKTKRILLKIKAQLAKGFLVSYKATCKPLRPTTIYNARRCKVMPLHQQWSYSKETTTLDTRYLQVPEMKIYKYKHSLG